ncbi:lipoprotein insertase outer membrane protein LolB [Bacterioplanoides sp.]|uniref:lipoprotein insertase outer membrane protein LolB n=1 Tax=Bacterioplanoides sp. TaxID=2066072 RepID=UPI003B004C9C
MIRFIGLMLVISLSGCASLLPQGGQETLQQQLSAINDWKVRGKLSVVTPQESVTGYLTWDQQETDYRLFITGPFGQGSSQLSGSAQHAELLLPGWEQPQVADNAEELMLRYMGWNFPVSDIRHWVKGQPAPSAENAASSKNTTTAVFDESGLLKELQQHGWQVKYSRYSRQQGFWLPGLIKVSGHNFRFVFSIKEWTING